MLKIENISFKFDNKPILSDINLTLQSQQIIALIGPNGAGKSTLFSLIGRLNFIQTGSIYFEHDGVRYDISETDYTKLSKIVSMLSQENHIQGRLRVKELLMFGRYPYHKGQPTQQDQEMITHMIKRFELTELENRFLSELSGGQKQRVLIAMVVCQDTPFLLLDEPLNNLDMYHTGRLMRELRWLTEELGKTVIIVLHDINQAAQFTDTVVMLKEGKVVTQGTPLEVLTQQNIKELYGVETTILMHQGKPVIVELL
ncbi:ATP-binding cassette domain-containing protein [Psychrobacter sp. HD31]|uniref:ATP-binding cassette domain-containing protein n=1 Tax=Psychrobacter sp. HD31 TaxID=3112003 RepID=UPI003DA4D65A